MIYIAHPITHDWEKRKNEKEIEGNNINTKGNNHNQPTQQLK